MLSFLLFSSPLFLCPPLSFSVLFSLGSCLDLDQQAVFSGLLLATFLATGQNFVVGWRCSLPPLTMALLDDTVFFCTLFAYSNICLRLARMFLSIEERRRFSSKALSLTLGFFFALSVAFRVLGQHVWELEQATMQKVLSFDLSSR
jgi:hypothetical protein